MIILALIFDMVMSIILFIVISPYAGTLCFLVLFVATIHIARRINSSNATRGEGREIHLVGDESSTPNSGHPLVEDLVSYATGRISKLGPEGRVIHGHLMGCRHDGQNCHAVVAAHQPASSSASTTEAHPLWRDLELFARGKIAHGTYSYNNVFDHLSSCSRQGQNCPEIVTKERAKLKKK